MKFYEVLVALKNVKQNCWRRAAPDPGWEAFPKAFREKWIASGMSVTLKAHCVWCCIPQLLKRNPGKGAGYWNEDAHECVHKDFKSTWNDYAEQYTGNESTAVRLLRCVSRYNYRNARLEWNSIEGVYEAWLLFFFTMVLWAKRKSYMFVWIRRERLNIERRTLRVWNNKLMRKYSPPFSAIALVTWRITRKMHKSDIFQRGNAPKWDIHAGIIPSLHGSTRACTHQASKHHTSV